MGDWTKGPWRLSGPDQFGDFTIQGPTEELAIAAVVNGEMRRMGGESKEHCANAHLIASAPDLYAALKEARSMLDSVGFDPDCDDDFMATWRKYINQIDAALSAAQEASR